MPDRATDEPLPEAVPAPRPSSVPEPVGGLVEPAALRRTTPASLRAQGVWEAVAALVEDRQAVLGRPLRVLDLGGGTGGLAVPLARLGHDVTVVDPSPDALAALERRAAEFGVAGRVTARQGDADSLAGVAPRDVAGPPSSGAGGGEPAPGTDQGLPGWDLVCCHGVLEVVDDPVASLVGVAGTLAPDGYVSLLVAGRLAVVLAKALAGDIVHATAALTSADGRWGRSDPLPRRFDLAGLTGLLDAAGLAPVQVHGVRVFADLVPSSALDTAAGREALAELERAVANHPAYAESLGSLGSGLHAIARRG